ncbi:cortexin domain-containing 1-like [Xyrauchen texanus]|uniref:cortexin domain-containing 1-like n=1 Tax=Xyrauchen texanus TaxID=154827 RepID=UPI002241AE8E|nr:cortexin domain-containing 1-like [Xyrauchen texanus]
MLSFVDNRFHSSALQEFFSENVLMFAGAFSSLSLHSKTLRINMDLPLPVSQLDVDVDLGFALFFLVLLCLFLLVTMVRCTQMVLDPYSAISVSTYLEEQEEQG